MVNNYLIELSMDECEGFEYAAAQQNIDWISKKLPYRIEYLGAYTDKENYIRLGLMAVGYLGQISSPQALYNLLGDFFSYIDFSGYGGNIPLIGIQPIYAEDVRELYHRCLINKIKESWYDDAYASIQERDAFHQYLDQRYYDYHLEEMLTQELQEMHQQYRSANAANAVSVQLVQRFEDIRRTFDNKLRLLGVTILPLRWRGTVLAIGKYHLYNLNSRVSIPRYTNQMSDLKMEIVDNAFDGCVGLKQALIAAQISSFGKSVFRNCSSLKSVTLDDTLSELPSDTFLGCSSLKSFEVPAGVKIIRNHVFCDCHSLKEVKLGAVRTIEYMAFGRCASLSEIELPDGLQEIGNHAFADSGLKNMRLPDSVNVIGYAAFENCDKLTSITLPVNLQEIPFNCFNNCTELNTVQAPPALKRIGAYAFANCQKLSCFSIPDGLESIEEHAFAGCNALQSIFIPPSVVSIGHDCFPDCTVIHCEPGSYAHLFAMEEEQGYRLI